MPSPPDIRTKGQPSFTKREAPNSTTPSSRGALCLVTAAVIWLAPSVLAQPPPDKSTIVGQWDRRDGQTLTHLTLTPTGQFRLSKEFQGHTQDYTGGYRITASVLELNPGTASVERLPYVLLDRDTLRLTRRDGSFLIWARSKENRARAAVRVGAPSSAVSGMTAPSAMESNATARTKPPAQTASSAGTPAAPLPVPGTLASFPQLDLQPANWSGFPDWVVQATTNPSAVYGVAVAPPPKPPPVGRATNLVTGNLSEADLAMADRVIEANTKHLDLGSGGTFTMSPGPLTSVDCLVLLAVKFHQERKALVPFGEFKSRLDELGGSEPAERFWAQYCETARAQNSCPAAFTTYIQMKSAATQRAVNRQLGAWAGAEAALQRARESDRQFRDKVAQRTEDASQARAAYLKKWDDDARAAQAAYDAWRSSIGPHRRN